MGMIDNMQDKMSGMDDEIRERFEDLKSREQAGSLDDKGREELQNMRAKFGMNKE